MVTVSHEEFMKALSDAGLSNKIDEVNSPWGVRIEDKGGTKTLVAMTPEEYRERAERALGRPLTDDEAFNPSCYYANAMCTSNGCRNAGGQCVLRFDRGWFCLCDN